VNKLNLRDITERHIQNMEKQYTVHKHLTDPNKAKQNEKDKARQREIDLRVKKSVPTEIQGGKYGSCIAANSETKAPVLIDVDDALVKDVLSRVRSHGGAEKRWDINQSEGEIAEGTVAKLLGDNGLTVEVKRDFKASDTGNFAVEFMCGGKPSGISTSQSEWWAIVLDGEQYNGEVILFIKKKRLERLLFPARKVRGGDNNKAEMFLVRIEELVKRMKGIS
jgi:hypothetical protein